MRTIIEMVNLTRLDCAIASAGQSRIALSQALNHIRHRSVFQKRLVDQPSMRATVADLALELEAQVALVFRLCRASERAASDPAEAAYVRLLTPAVKFLVCKSTPQIVYEALECLGGNGYTEELPLARYFRESPLNAIWEGSGNVMALDVLRAAGRHPEQAMATLGALARRLRGRSTCGRSPGCWPPCCAPATPSGARVSCARAWRKSPLSPLWPRRSPISPRSMATRAWRARGSPSSAPPISAAQSRR